MIICQPELKHQGLTIYDKVLVASLFETTADQEIYHTLDKVLINCTGQRCSIMCRHFVLRVIACSGASGK